MRWFFIYELLENRQENITKRNHKSPPPKKRLEWKIRYHYDLEILKHMYEERSKHL